VDAPGEARADAEIICDFAKRMGYKGFDFENAAAIYEEHTQITKGTNVDISGLNYEVLQEKKTVQWPFNESTPDYGTQRLFTDKKFYTPSTKAIIHSVPDDLTSEKPSPDFPFVLTTGRIRDQWHTMSRSGKVNKLKQHIPQAFVEIHPEDARRLQIADNEIVVVQSRRGEVRVKGKVTDTIKKGVVFLPMHWGKILGSDLNRSNNLTNNLLDPISKEPDFKFCAVQVAK
jgi:ferredoxin-nitrate reductase